jgi:hypothetical protein
MLMGVCVGLCVVLDTGNACRALKIAVEGVVGFGDSQGLAESLVRTRTRESLTNYRTSLFLRLQTWWLEGSDHR